MHVIFLRFKMIAHQKKICKKLKTGAKMTHFPLEIVKFKKDNQIGKIVGWSNATQIYKVKIAKGVYLSAKEEDLFSDYQTFSELN